MMSLHVEVFTKCLQLEDDVEDDDFDEDDDFEDEDDDQDDDEDKEDEPETWQVVLHASSPKGWLRLDFRG